MYCLPDSICLVLQWSHHHHPVPDYGVHSNVENIGGQSSTLHQPTVALEGGGGELASILRHNMHPIPVYPQELEHPGTHSVSHQDIKATVPIQGVLRLLDIQ